MIDLILLLLLSVISARLLERKYKVASIVHAILFIVQAAIFIFTTEIPFVRYAMMNMVGKNAYNLVNSILSIPSFITIGGISAVVMVDLSILVFLPLLSIILFIDRIREEFKKVRYKVSIKYIIEYVIVLVGLPLKTFNPTKDNTYLELSQLRN